MGVAIQNQKPGQKKKSAIRLVPPWYLEYGYYGILVYALLGPVLGLAIDRLGIVLLAGLASLSLLYFRERPVDYFRFLVFPVGLGISYLIIQMMYHGLSIQQEYVKNFHPVAPDSISCSIAFCQNRVFSSFRHLHFAFGYV